MFSDPRHEAAAAAAGPATVAEDVLDQDVVSGLVELGDAEFFAELVDDFVASTNSYMATLQAAVAAGDAGTAYGTAHTMKSSSANMGATRLAEICRAVETAGREGDLAAVDAHLGELRSSYEDARVALEAAVADLAG